MHVAALLAAALLALVHMIAGELRFLRGVPRSRWLSAAGGVAVAYVFLHLIPELGHRQEALATAVNGALGAIDRHIYVVALIGLGMFYGLERLAKTSRRRGADAEANAGVFWIHIGSFSIYSALIGYLLVAAQERSGRELLFFTAAMALHFVTTDFGLQEDHQRVYRRIGRWLLAASVLLGCLVGLVAELPEAALAVLLAFLAGGVILNVLKEELPEERESRFGAFVLGAAGYAAILLAL